MVNFTIKDDIGNVIYNRVDDENQLTDEEIEQIYKALSDLDSNMVEFSLSKEHNNDNSHIAYSSSRRCGKSETLRQCKALCDEYNKQVAALPVRHPLEYDATGVRESVDSEEPVDSVDSKNLDKSDGAVKPDDRGFVSAPTLKRNEFYEKPYEKNCHFSTLSVIPGTYVGCGKYERCKKPNKRAKEDKQYNKEKCTETCKIEDFIDFLNTYDSWATLIQELQFHSKKQTQQGKTKLINKYKKWKREQ